MKKLLFITPHLSTGGLPQFLLKKVKTLVDVFEVYVIEWENVTGNILIVQRKQIEDLLIDKFISLGSDKQKIIDIINNIKPDIIHFEEYAETFIPDDILTTICSNKSYNIVETTHGTLFNLDEKWIMTDKTMFVSGNNMEQYITSTNDFDVIEYPISTNQTKEYFQTLLGLDSNYFHILNVGLFNENKNQAEIIEYAKKLTDKKVKFHFVGNMASNFKSYWEPLISTAPKNCIMWGERSDAFKFYNACDMFLFTSKLENRPISVNEALSHNLPTLMYNLSNYGNYYVDNKNIKFLTDNFNSNVDLILQHIDKKFNIANIDIINTTTSTTTIATTTNIVNTINNNFNIKAVHLLTDIMSNREQQSIRTLSKLKDYNIKYEMFINEPYKDLPPKETCAFPDIIDMKPGGKLTPAHYGCYLAHKNGLLNAIKENVYDYILIFECDCGLKTTMNMFINKINNACNILNNTDAEMFSFVHHHGEHIIEKTTSYYMLSEFIGAHAYMIPRKAYDKFIKLYETTLWNVTDLFFANNLKRHGIKIATFDEVITFQYPGESLLEKTVNLNERI